MPELVNLKVCELRKRGYNDVSEWLSNPNHLYIGRRMRIFIHTKKKTTEESGTKVSRNENGDKILIRPNKLNKNIEFDANLLSYPVGSYVDKNNKIIHLCIIPKSKWYNPFKIKKKTNGRGEIIDEFEKYLLNNKSLINDINNFDNYTEIGCWCKPKGCHGDTILKQYHLLKNKKNNKTLKRNGNNNNNHNECKQEPPSKKRKINHYFQKKKQQKL